MSREKLKSIIAERLELSENEKEFAFGALIKRVTEKLSFSEALKINNIGVFQLKKEPLPRQERSSLLSAAAREKRTLIYSPPFENLKGDINSLFLTLDLDDFTMISGDDVDNVFSLSVNKPIISLSDESSSDQTEHDKEIGRDELIDKEISALVENGAVLRNFDIWEEYLKFSGGMKQDTADDNTQIDEIVKSESMDEVLPTDLPAEPDIIKSKIEDAQEPAAGFSDELNDDLKAFEEIAELEKRLTGIDSSDDESLLEDQEQEIEEESDSILDENEEVDISELIGEESEISLAQEGDEIKDDDKSLFDELEDYLKEGDDTADQIAEEIENDDSDEPVLKKSEDISVKEEIITDKKDEPKDELKRDIAGKSREPFYLNPAFVVTVSVLIIATIIYFIFIPELNKKDDIVAEPENTSISVPPREELNPPLGEQPVDKKVEHQVEPVESVKSERTGLYRDIKNDNQVANQIFYDGDVYTVQVSSWRSSTIAEREVERLKKAGHDAFIYKVYLESKGSTWNRVRIGYFNTLEEAEDFLVKNSF